MSSKPTLRDIAEATGVSTASVSMILNGKSLERFSSQRVASVLAEAERIGYRTPSARCSGRQPAEPHPRDDAHDECARGRRERLTEAQKTEKLFSLPCGGEYFYHLSRSWATFAQKC